MREAVGCVFMPGVDHAPFLSRLSGVWRVGGTRRGEYLSSAVTESWHFLKNTEFWPNGQIFLICTPPGAWGRRACGRCRLRSVARGLPFTLNGAPACADEHVGVVLAYRAVLAVRNKFRLWQGLVTGEALASLSVLERIASRRAKGRWPYGRRFQLLHGVHVTNSTCVPIPATPRHGG